MLQVISLLLENKPGALMRVTGLLSPRGYNIESLTVARTLDPALSRMTIVVDVEGALRPQVMAQVRRGDEIIICDNCNRILYYVTGNNKPMNSSSERSEMATT